MNFFNRYRWPLALGVTIIIIIVTAIAFYRRQQPTISVLPSATVAAPATSATLNSVEGPIKAGSYIVIKGKISRVPTAKQPRSKEQ